jgi:small conductance mechanosensitive channel
LLLVSLGLCGGLAQAQSDVAPAGAAEAGEAPPRDPLIEEAEALWSGYQARQTQIAALRRQLRGRSGEDLLVIEEKIWAKQLEVLVITRELTDNVLAQEEKQLDASEMRANITGAFERGVEGFEKHFAWRDDRVAALRKRREEATGSDRIELEKHLTVEQDQFQTALSELGLTLDAMRLLGLDTTAGQAELESRLIDRAEDLSARLEIDWRNRAALRERLERDPDSAELTVELEGVDESFQRRERLLSATISAMEPLELETAAYHEALIQTTGQLSTGIFDREVAAGLLQRGMRSLSDRLAERGPVWAMQVLLFALVLVVFWMASVVARRVVSRVVRTSRVEMSQLLRDTLVAWSSRVVFFVGLLVALSQVGIEIGPLLAGLGIAGFIVGFALQDSLANFAAGAMILIYRPYDVDDVIESGAVRGRVSHMSLVSTTILTFDNQTLIVPNNKIWGDVIRNVTAQSARRIDLIFRVGYDEDVERVEKLLMDAITSHDKVLEDPAPAVKLHMLTEFAIEFAVRPWVNREDYWDVYWDLTRAIKLAFDREGISLPKPQREIHVHRADALPPA